MIVLAFKVVIIHKHISLYIEGFPLKPHIPILLNVQEREKLIDIPSHFNAFLTGFYSSVCMKF